MGNINGISGELTKAYENIASGTKINSAADDAAGLAIVEKEDSQIKGLNIGKNNMAMANDSLKVADSALGSISDYLQRIRELSVQASGIASDDDKKMMQAEVSELLKGIEDVSQNTTFNTKKLLNGENKEFEIATNGNGASTVLEMPNATLKALGMENYDLTGDFDIETVDEALEKVQSGRSRLGAKTNAIEYAINANAGAAYYHTAAKSRIEDTDFPEAVMEKKKNEALLQYQMIMQKKKEEQEANKVNKLIGS